LSEKSHERGSVETLLRVVKFLRGERDALKDTLVEVEGDPTDPRCWLYRAQELLETDRLKEAEVAAIRGTMANTETDLRTLSEVWEMIGHILYRMKRPQDGVEAYLVAFGLDHCSSSAASLAKALSESGLHEQAQKVLELAVEDGTEISEVFIRLGIRYWDIDRRHDARRMYRRATELAPENLNWPVPYVHLLIDLGEFDEAQKELERIKAVGSDHRYADYYAEVLRSRREDLWGDLIMVKERNAQLPRLIRDVGAITDWIHREVEGVDTVSTDMRPRARTGLRDHYSVTGIDVCVNGDDLHRIRRQVEQELEKRAFMYGDYSFEFKDKDRLGLPRVVLSISPRPRSYFIDDETAYKGKVSAETSRYISDLLAQASNRTHMSNIVGAFLSSGCRCGQISHAINLIELVMTWNDFDEQEVVAAEACLSSLEDLRIGTGLLLLWKNRDTIRPIWLGRLDRDREFIAQTYDWFRYLRGMTCHTLCLEGQVADATGVQQMCSGETAHGETGSSWTTG
jgi:hypothetical protein